MKNNIFMAVGLLAAASIGWAATDLQSFDSAELNNAGAVPLNALTMQFFFNIKTGRQIDPRTVVEHSIHSFPDKWQSIARTLVDTNDEFERRDASQKLQPYTNRLYEKTKIAKQYLIPAIVRVGEFDFDRKRFPVQVSLEMTNPEYSGGMYCSSGAYAIKQGRKQQACVYAPELQTNTNPFQWIEMADVETAKKLRDVFTPKNLKGVLQISVAGAFKELSGDKRLGNLQFDATHVLPMKIHALYLSDYRNDTLVMTLHPRNPTPVRVADKAMPMTKASENAKASPHTIKLD